MLRKIHALAPESDEALRVISTRRVRITRDRDAKARANQVFTGTGAAQRGTVPRSQRSVIDLGF
jgi:hypothetical protein